MNVQGRKKWDLVHQFGKDVFGWLVDMVVGDECRMVCRMLRITGLGQREKNYQLF